MTSQYYDPRTPRTNRLENPEACDHAEVIRDDYPDWQYDYCPECLEKL